MPIDEMYYNSFIIVLTFVIVVFVKIKIDETQIVKDIH
jgi:hypothetical protein